MKYVDIWEHIVVELRTGLEKHQYQMVLNKEKNMVGITTIEEHSLYICLYENLNMFLDI